MDMRQAADFFKTRWKWRKEPAWYQEEKVKRLERQKALVAARKASQQAQPEDKDGQLPKEKRPAEVPPAKKTTPQPTTAPAKEPANTHAGGEAVIGRNKEQRLKDRKEKEQQVIDLYLQQVLEGLNSVKQDAAVKRVHSKTIELLGKQEVEPEQLLAFGRELDKLAAGNKEVRTFVTKQKEDVKRNTKDKDAWDRINHELKHLDDLERKGNKLEFSSNLAGTTLSILDAFLGPAGPIFQTARELYKEYKDDAKGLLAKVAKVPKYVGDKLSVLRKVWGRRDTLFKRMFPKFASALDKFGRGLKEKGKSFAGKFAGGKGKFGKLAAAGSAVLGFLGTDIGKAVTILSVSGIAGMFMGKKKDEDGKPKDEKDSVFSVQSIKNGLHSITGKITGMFGDLTGWLGKTWTSMSNWMSDSYNMMLVGYDSAVLKVKIFKDDLEEMRDRLFDGIVDYFDGVWDKIKGMLPDYVKRAMGMKEDEETVERKPIEKTEKPPEEKRELARAVAPASAPSDPLGGDGKNKADVVKPTAPTVAPQEGQKAIVLNGNVDLAGMNPGLMDNFYSMVGEFYKLTGKKVGVNSGKRSGEKQAALHAANPAKAAKPGYSMHEFGLAIDINSAEANMMESMGLFKKYGFVRPISNEAWHIEPLAIQGMKSAIRRGKEEAVIAKTGGAGDSANSKSETEGAPSAAQVAATPTPAPLAAKESAQATAAAAPSVTQTPPAKAGASSVAPAAAQGATALMAAQPQSATAQAPSATPMAAAMPTTQPSMPAPPASFVSKSADSLKNLAVSKGESAVTSLASQIPEASAAMLPESVTAPMSIAGDVGASIAPAAGSAYDAVASRSRRIDKTFTPEPVAERNGVASRTSAKTSSNHIPFYLGDMGMLTLNLGIGA